MDQITAEKLAEVLQEPNLPLLRQVVRILGHDRTAAVLVDALQIEAAGGLMTKDGTRRRTPGGTFFQRVRQCARPHERRRLFPQPAPPPGQGGPQPAQLITWEEVRIITQTLATAPAGEARTMKVTLIGRPEKIETRQQCVVFKLQGRPPGSLPKGLPAPAGPPLSWTVMVALRQWNRVKDSLAGNPEDQLVIDGYPLMQGSEHILLVQSCVSMLQQRAQKAARQPAAGETP